MKSLQGLVVSLGILTIMLTGCGGDTGPETTPVTGTVLLDGEPVEGATVNFLAGASAHAATGTTDAKGEFSLTTMTMDKPGAVAGTYTVTISKYPASEAAETTPDDYLAQMQSGTGAPAGPESELPAKYANPANWGFEATVEEGVENDFTFEL